MAVDINNDIKDIRFRTVTMSLRVDEGCTEAIIQNALAHWNRGIKGSAYILHDKDSYTEKEVKDINNRLDKEIYALNETGSATQAKIDAIQKRKVVIGEAKPAHWHILLDFGTSPKSVAAIATMFHTIPSMVMQVRGKKKGFANILAYLTHITPEAMSDGKFEYDPKEVKGIRFPEIDQYEHFVTYEDFANAYLEGKLAFEFTAKDVLLGKITPQELMHKDPDYFLKHEPMIRRARINYNNNKPTPNYLFNYFVGVGDSSIEGSQGRIGKGLMCKLLALSHLAMMFPNINFDTMTNDDLITKGYIYWAGGAGVAFQDYDGQPIIIWEDCRAEDLIKTFGSINNVYKTLDTHPKPTAISIKYGEVKLKNSIFIFDGAQTYDTFIKGLSIKEDMSQAKGRFPFILEITRSTITATVQLEYLIGTQEYNWRRTYKNDLPDLARTHRLNIGSKIIGTPFTNAINQTIDKMDNVHTSISNPLEEINEFEADMLKQKDGVKTSTELAKIRNVLDYNDMHDQNIEDQNIEDNPK